MNMHDAWFANDEDTRTSKTVIMAYTIRKFHPCTSLVLLLVSILISWTFNLPHGPHMWQNVKSEIDLLNSVA